MWFAFGALAAGGLATGYILQPSVSAADLELHPPHFPWSHNGFLSSLDHARYMYMFEECCDYCLASLGKHCYC